MLQMIGNFSFEWGRKKIKIYVYCYGQRYADGQFSFPTLDFLSHKILIDRKKTSMFK